MKNTFVLLAMFSANIYASEARNDPFMDQDLSCVVKSDNKRYEDIFLVEVRETGNSHLQYKRIHLASPKDENGNLTYGDWEIVRGCYHGIQTKFDRRPEVLSIECSDDGEEGIVTLFPAEDGKNFMGEIYFYMPQIGYSERTLLEVSCTKL